MSRYNKAVEYQEEMENTSPQISDNDNEETAQGWNGLIISTVSANVFISVYVFRSRQRFTYIYIYLLYLYLLYVLSMFISSYR